MTQKYERKYETTYGLPLEKYYKPAEAGDESGKVHPGKYPFDRGIYEGMYRDEMWLIGQYAGFGTAPDSNKRWHRLREEGATGMYIALDLPTQLGYDSDDALAEGEVGRLGVAIDTLADLEDLFEGIELEHIGQLHTTANSIGPVMLGLLIALIEKKGYDPKQIRIALQNDVLKEYFSRGTYIFPIKPAVKLSVDVIEYCTKNLPLASPICVCGTHIRSSGASIIQEVAFALADAIAYIEEALSRGLAIDDVVHNWEFLAGMQLTMLEDVAKLRAIRRIWSKLLVERYGATPEKCGLRIQATPNGVSLASKQIENNIVRIGLQKLTAALGGAQWVYSMQFDEALSIPTEESSILSIRTQQILQLETDIPLTSDPLGGSYLIEHLTDDIETRVFKELDNVLDMGGAPAAIENRYFESSIFAGAEEQQRRLDQHERYLVGINCFRTEEKTKRQIFKLEESWEDDQKNRLAKVKQSRDAAQVQACLEAIKRAAEHNDNIVPAVIAAAHAYVTVGEMCDVLRNVYGTL